MLLQGTGISRECAAHEIPATLGRLGWEVPRVVVRRPHRSSVSKIARLGEASSTPVRGSLHGPTDRARGRLAHVQPRCQRGSFRPYGRTSSRRSCRPLGGRGGWAVEVERNFTPPQPSGIPITRSPNWCRAGPQKHQSQRYLAPTLAGKNSSQAGAAAE
jgi:hypothetical protein